MFIGNAGWKWKYLVGANIINLKNVDLKRDAISQKVHSKSESSTILVPSSTKQSLQLEAVESYLPTDLDLQLISKVLVFP